MSPYRQALQWIEHNPGTGSAGRLAKLLLSLWNSIDCPYSVAECLENMDERRTQIVLECVAHFAQHGENQELVTIGYRVHELYPRLWELGVAARDAKAALRQSWEDEDRRAAESSEP